MHQEWELRHFTKKGLKKMLREQEKFIADKKKGEAAKSKAEMDKEAIERELKFREVLDEIKRIHVRALSNLLVPNFRRGKRKPF